MSQRLTNELNLLYKCERDYKLPAAPIVRQLAAWEQQRLPDLLPPPPQWTTFDWPASGEVNFERAWRVRDTWLVQ